MLELIIIYILVGIVAGIIVGVVGAGSSLVILPILCVIFPHFFPIAYAIKLAVGTTLASITVSAIAAAIGQRNHVSVNKKICTIAMLVYVFGGLAGAYLAHYMPVSWLNFYIGVLLLLMAIKNLFFVSKDGQKKPLPGLFQMIIVAFLIAIVCGVAGVASGLLFIPYLSRFLPHRVAVATSIVSAIAFASFGTVGYIISGWHTTAQLHWAWGYVYVPAFFMIAIAIVPGSVVGLKIAYRLDVKLIKKIFYVFLILAGSYISVFL